MNQRGTAPILILVAVVGLLGITFLLFPIKESYAAILQGTLTRTLNWSTPKADFTGMLGDPARPSDFYAFYQTPGGNQGVNHIMKSTNYGQTWTQIDQTTFNGNAWGVAIDPNPNRNPATSPVMYAPAGYGDNGIWKSLDGGRNWSNIMPSSFYQNCLVPKKGGGTVAIPRDSNNGCMDFYQIHILPDNPPNHLLVTYHYGNGQLLESTDGGQTWEVHSVPWGNSHYILGTSATNWLVVSQDFGMGIYRTTTAGRNGSGVISTSAWTRTTQDGSPSPFYHMHGNFTPYVDTNGDIYFAGGGGVICSSNQGANWHVVIDGNMATVNGTGSYLYASLGGANVMWQIPKGCNNPTIDHNSYPTLTVPAQWQGLVTPYGAVSAFNGTNWVINMGTYGTTTVNGDIWRYVEPATGATPAPTPLPSSGQAIPGDINSSGKVDIFDYNLLITDYGATSGVGLRSDIDHNNRVDIFDYNLLLTNFGKP